VAVGLLGGAFDPPHLGHVRLAEAALEGLRLERILVLVVEDPGHKTVATPADDRLALARLAFEPIPKAVVELDPYERTVDSLEARRPEDAYFVLGADELADFWSWKRPERILELVRLAAAVRPGVAEAELQRALARFPPGCVTCFEMAPVEVSSSEIRERVGRGESIAGLVPPPVADEIARRGLYLARE
jgi:nicotinate-nucleotide adenylyltransferase